jgi:hypothetical protein
MVKFSFVQEYAQNMVHFGDEKRKTARSFLEKTPKNRI